MFINELLWSDQKTPENLQKALSVLAKNYPIKKVGHQKCNLDFIYSPSQSRYLKIKSFDNLFKIEYSDLTLALRGIGILLSSPQSNLFEEKVQFNTIGTMLDCSRNAVVKISHLKKWMDRLALLGFNLFMLYMEDTFKLDGEDYFGYQRGGYTSEELKDLDEYASNLGIEIVPCIQTLGHLEQILKWEQYESIKDIDGVLLVDENKTYELIEKMIRHFATTLKTHKIHIGFDEAHNIGRGKYLDLNGYNKGINIVTKHLKKVTYICEKYKLKPMAWSDMFFRLANKSNDYYDQNTDIDVNLSKEISSQIQLVYWDYYHVNESFYLNWINKHRQMGTEPLMASGIWTWWALWYDRNATQKTILPCIEACKKAKIKEIFFTLWGDDGACCNIDSALAGLALAAEMTHSNKKNISTTTIQSRFNTICKSDYLFYDLAGKLNYYDEDTFSDLGKDSIDWYKKVIHAENILWDDPLLGLFFHREHLNRAGIWGKVEHYYDTLLKKLIDTNPIGKNNDLNIKYVFILTKLLLKKVRMRNVLLNAYKDNSHSGLNEAIQEINSTIEALEEFDNIFRSIWIKRNKPFGLEVIQIRLAGQKRRLKELIQRLKELLDGQIKTIPELENSSSKTSFWYTKYERVATSSFLGVVRQ